MNIMRFFGFDGDEDDYDDNESYVDDRKKRASGRGSRSDASHPAGKLIIYNYNSPTLSTDKAHLRDEFLKGAMILVDLHELNQRQYEEEGKDFITFMGGLAFAREGVMTFIEPSQYLFTPGQGMCEVWPEGSDQQ
ncbi:MAG: cell division protein SepF [Synergistaceae bacterium]|nr:cell division protein SepF [Synergistaceae bacterium]